MLNEGSRLCARRFGDFAADTQMIERAHCVGGHEQPGAELLERSCLLINRHFTAVPLERQRCGQSADARSNDDDVTGSDRFRPPRSLAHGPEHSQFLDQPLFLRDLAHGEVTLIRALLRENGSPSNWVRVAAKAGSWKPCANAPAGA